RFAQVFLIRTGISRTNLLYSKTVIELGDARLRRDCFAGGAASILLRPGNAFVPREGGNPMALALPAVEAVGRPALPPSTRRGGKKAPQAPRLSVVIVNYCQWEQTQQLVEQLQAARCARNGTAEVVIVDNHSPSHPLAGRLRRRPGVSLR